MSIVVKKVVVVAGYCPGIGDAVALKFGMERGYSIALLSRSRSKLDCAVAQLNAIGIEASACCVDLASPEAVGAAIEEVQKKVGEINILFWYGGGYGKTLLDLTSQPCHQSFSIINVDSLVYALKAAMCDLEKNKGAVLVTGGLLGTGSEEAAELAAAADASSWVLSKAAQHKLVHILNLTLKPRGIFVGEVTVSAAVQGTASDPEGKAPLTREAVADAFVHLLDSREATFVTVR